MKSVNELNEIAKTKIYEIIKTLKVGDELQYNTGKGIITKINKKSVIVDGDIRLGWNKLLGLIY